VVLVNEQDVTPRLVAPLFVRGECVAKWFDSLQQSNFVNEGQQSDSLPSKFLSVHVDWKVFWVKILDGGILRDHQLLIGKRQVLFAASGEDSHELSQWFEGNSQLEGDHKLSDLVQV
jgi:hypothetical protein